MKQVCISLFAILFVLSAATIGFGDTFTYGFAGPNALLGGAGDTASTVCQTTLQHDNPEGNQQASGWSFSVRADNATITAIDVAGTAAEEAEFNQTELSKAGGVDGCEGDPSGAVSAIVLALIDDVSLEAGPTHMTSNLAVEATIPDDGGTATLSFVNGCRGSGQPVDSVVTQGGDSATPSLVSKDIALTVVVCFCDDAVGIAFSGSNVPEGSPIYSDAVGVGSVDPANPCANEDEKCEANGILSLPGGAPGDTAQGTVYVNLISQIPEGGEQVSGWSLSIKYEGNGSLLDVTTDGTVAERAEFNQTEVVDPKVNGGMQGCVSAIVLALIDPDSLAPGQGTVLAMNFDGVVPDEGSGSGAGTGSSGAVFALDGLRGAGQPVDNVGTVGGDSIGYANAGTARAELVFEVAQLRDFVRGNANNDTKIDIADSIWIINFLFRGGGSPPCMDAADVNDNGMVDLADAQAGIVYLFPSAASEFGIDSLPPSAPFPDCGKDPSDEESEEGDGLPCDVTGAGCE